MDRNKQFFIKHNTNTARSVIQNIEYRVDVNTMQHLEPQDFKLNEIGLVQITTAKNIYFDAFKKNKQTGAFILIDPITNNTSAVGMIVRPLEEDSLNEMELPTVSLSKLGIGAEHREAIETAAKELSRQGIEIKVVD